MRISAGLARRREEIAYIDASLGHEGETALRVGGGVLCEILEAVVFVFVVADVAVTEDNH